MIILLTAGERGGNPDTRREEFKAAMKFLGFEYNLLNFPDRELEYIPLKKMVRAVEEIVKSQNISMLVSFSPFELTKGFDHPDHNRTGVVTRQVSVAMKGKRKLWLWTSRGKASFTLEKAKYVKEYYPSQKVPEKVLEQLGESYIVIR